jgi:hypothetical protein
VAEPVRPTPGDHSQGGHRQRAAGRGATSGAPVRTNGVCDPEPPGRGVGRASRPRPGPGPAGHGGGDRSTW